MTKHNTVFHFLRHGESKANTAGIIICNPCDGIHDWGLTERGAQQVMLSTADFLRRNKIDLVCSSDFLRARETAEIVRKMSGAPLKLTPLLRERDFAHLHGMPDHCYNNVWAEDARHAKYGTVETIQSVLTRSFTILHWLSSYYNGQSIILVSHGDVIQLTIAALCRKNACEHRQLDPVLNAEYREISIDGRIGEIKGKYKLIV